MSNGFGLFVESLKGNFVPIEWYVNKLDAEADAMLMNAALGISDYPVCIVRPLNYKQYMRDPEVY